MKFLLIWFCSITLIPISANACPDKEHNLLHNILNAQEIYLMKDKDKWSLIAGNPEHLLTQFFPYNDLLENKKAMSPLKHPNLTFYEKMSKNGNLFLAFNLRGITLKYFTMNEYSMQRHHYGSGLSAKEQYPKVPTLCKDIIWLCRNKWLLKKLSEGSLKLEDYRMSQREFTLIMRFCPKEWREALVKYANSDKTLVTENSEEKLQQILENCLSPEKEVLAKYPYLKGIDPFEMYYPELLKVWKGNLSDLLLIEYRKLIESLKENQKLTRKEHFIVRSILRDETLNQTMLNEYFELKSLRAYIIKYKDLELLKAYLFRVERRQSKADIPMLGEFLQSDLYIKGKQRFRELILDQCGHRKENEVVWLLADSLTVPLPTDVDPNKKPLVNSTKNRAKLIMMKFTHEDLGDDPKAWKKWYRDQ